MTDGGIHQLHYDGQIRGMYFPRIQMIPEAGDAQEQEWTVCGALCTVNDLLLCRARLAGAAIGKTLVFEQTGAYSATEGMALFLSRELPAVALYSGIWGGSRSAPAADLSLDNEKGGRRMETLLMILNEIDDSIDYEKEEALITGRVLDSFAVITLVSELEAAYDVRIEAAQMTPENFNSVRAMWR